MEANSIVLNQNVTSEKELREELQMKNRLFRWKTAMAYRKDAPALSAMMMLKFIQSTATLKAKVQRGLCRFCGSIFAPGNHTLRFASKSKSSKDIEKLKRTQKDASWKLNKLHKKYLESAKTRASKMIYRCLRCRKCTKLPLENSPNQLSKIKSFEPATPHVECTPQIKKKNQSFKIKSAENIQLSNKQHLLNSMKKNNNKKKKNKKQKKGNFCQLKSLLKTRTQENSMKSRLESFLSSLL